MLNHGLRTPLTPVIMATHMISRTPGLPASVQMAVETIQRNVAIEAQFIDDLLDLTKLAHGKLEIVREPVDLHEAVRRAVEVSAADLENKHQKIMVTREAAEHELQGDATPLQQVFWNLLKNASKFTAKGGAVHVTSRNEPGRIFVEVADTGIGFDAEAATRIFDAFAQTTVFWHKFSNEHSSKCYRLVLAATTWQDWLGDLLPCRPPTVLPPEYFGTH